MLEILNLVQKYKLARKAKPFTLKEGIMCRVGQDNKMHKCLTTSVTHIVFKELHEGMVRGHFVINITTKKIWNVGYWCPNLLKNIHEFCKSCDSCQKIGKFKNKKFN
jgi:hypothetical protein